MPVLSSDLRKTLETTVVKARDLAERGARDALTALAVDASEPFASMSEEERKLRNRLRAHGRQLGDQRDPQKGTQSIERLVREMAYEHWHRMLFARFLAENQLLIEPTSGVSINLQECEELAAEEGTDLWGLAAQFAQSMLPAIFRTNDPVLALRLPLEIRQHLQTLVEGLECEVFTTSDGLGWTYQFWQTRRKADVNEQVKSGLKVGADELSPVTQLFTEDYMVDFLLDNTLGAWHAGKVLAANPQLASSAQSEDDLRQAVALPGCPWSYLRFVKTDEGAWAPASGAFEGWPRSAAELKCLDPCMGSGHFVVAMFERLVALRIDEEGLNEKSAVAAVIEGNLFGLEIDPRCTQIGAFNLALAAWRRVGHCKLPAMNLACSGLAPNIPESNWLELAGDNERLRNGMKRLYTLFRQASLLGSFINPQFSENDLLVAEFSFLKPLLESALDQEDDNDTEQELAVTARGIAKAAQILGSKFNLVATNPPYVGQLKQSVPLRDWMEANHFDAKSDLSTALFSRMIDLCGSKGVAAAVLPGELTYLKRLASFRKRLLATTTFRLLVDLGKDAFQTTLRVQPCLVAITKSPPPDQNAFPFWEIKEKSIAAKASAICSQEAIRISQASQLTNADCSIRRPEGSELPLLSEYVVGLTGVTTGAGDQFFRYFWEVTDFNGNWEPMQSSIDRTGFYSGFSLAIRWQNESGELARYAESVRHLNHVAQNWRRGKASWGKHGVAISKMGDLGQSPYFGAIYNENCCALIPHTSEDLAAIWCFAESGKQAEEIRKINKSLLVQTKYLTKVPIDIDYWREVAKTKYPQGIPGPFSDHPTQWIFHGHPRMAKHALQVATCRLLGYRWLAETKQNMELSETAKSWVSNCEDLVELADEDGIICLSPIRGEQAAGERLRSFLRIAFGSEWSNSKERELLLEAAKTNDAKKAASTLEDWLRQSFFAEHCKLFKSHPFIWQIWDGNASGFSALVNYHKLAAPNGQGRKTLELLTYTYLGDWIDRQKLAQAEGINGADDRLAAAVDLQGQLKKILDGEPPFDIFVRWKALCHQPIGWEPDINDGVRINIRPFLLAQLRKGGKMGAGILRSKPSTIDWSKDRGKEPSRTRVDFPWFWGWDENNPAMATDFGAPIPGAPPAGDSFDGNRWNDLHYTRAAKEAARARHRGEA